MKHKAQVPGFEPKPKKVETEKPLFEEDVKATKQMRELLVATGELQESINRVEKVFEPSEELKHIDATINGLLSKRTEIEAEEKAELLGQPYQEARGKVQEQLQQLVTLMQEHKTNAVEVKNRLVRLSKVGVRSSSLTTNLVKSVLKELEMTKEQIDKIMLEGKKFADKDVIETVLTSQGSVTAGMWDWLKRGFTKLTGWLSSLVNTTKESLTNWDSIDADLDQLEAAAVEASKKEAADKVTIWEYEDANDYTKTEVGEDELLPENLLTDEEMAKTDKAIEEFDETLEASKKKAVDYMDVSMYDTPEEAIDVGFLVEIQRGRYEDQIGEIVDFSVEDDQVDVLMSDGSEIHPGLKDVKLVEFPSTEASKKKAFTITYPDPTGEVYAKVMELKNLPGPIVETGPEGVILECMDTEANDLITQLDNSGLSPADYATSSTNDQLVDQVLQQAGKTRKTTIAQKVKKLLSRKSKAEDYDPAIGDEGINPIPKDSNWTDFAEAFDIGTLDLDKFASLMGFNDFKDLDISISPKHLLQSEGIKFVEALQQSSLRAEDMDEDTIVGKVNALWGSKKQADSMIEHTELTSAEEGTTIEMTEDVETNHGTTIPTGTQDVVSHIRQGEVKLANHGWLALSSEQFKIVADRTFAEIDFYEKGTSISVNKQKGIVVTSSLEEVTIKFEDGQVRRVAMTEVDKEVVAISTKFVRPTNIKVSQAKGKLTHTPNNITVGYDNLTDTFHTVANGSEVSEELDEAHAVQLLTDKGVTNPNQVVTDAQVMGSIEVKCYMKVEAYDAYEPVVGDKGKVRQEQVGESDPTGFTITEVENGSYQVRWDDGLEENVNQRQLNNWKPTWGSKKKSDKEADGFIKQTAEDYDMSIEKVQIAYDAHGATQEFYNALEEEIKQRATQSAKKKAEYKPYEGGAGPTEEQVVQNNQALKEALAEIGIEAKDIDINEELHLGTDPTPGLEISKEDSEQLLVGYDRWGFVIDYPKEFVVDQAGMEETVDAIKRYAEIKQRTAQSSKKKSNEQKDIHITHNWVDEEEEGEVIPETEILPMTKDVFDNYIQRFGRDSDKVDYDWEEGTIIIDEE